MHYVSHLMLPDLGNDLPLLYTEAHTPRHQQRRILKRRRGSRRCCGRAAGVDGGEPWGAGGFVPLERALLHRDVCQVRPSTAIACTARDEVIVINPWRASCRSITHRNKICSAPRFDPKPSFASRDSRAPILEGR